MSLGFIEYTGLLNVLIWPCCVDVYIISEYAAVKKLINEILIKDIVDFEIIEEISMISLSKLIEGGAAIFAAANRNHHIVMIGLIIISPFVKNILRVCVISYDIFAIINSADDLSPWAIIIIKALDKPHVVIVNIPVNINPICPTDE